MGMVDELVEGLRWYVLMEWDGYWDMEGLLL